MIWINCADADFRLGAYVSLPVREEADHFTGPSQLKWAESCSENCFDLGRTEIEPVSASGCNQRSVFTFFPHQWRQKQSKMLGNLPNLFRCEHHQLPRPRPAGISGKPSSFKRPPAPRILSNNRALRLPRINRSCRQQR
jgi:hypothetical protein